MLSLKRAKEIKMIFLDEIEQTKTLPGRLVQPFWEFYSREFRPHEYATIPCTCSPKEWIKMIENVKTEVNKVLASDGQDQSSAVMVEAQPEVKKKITTAVVEDKK